MKKILIFSTCFLFAINAGAQIPLGAVPEGAVTQHEAALTIDSNQISNSGNIPIDSAGFIGTLDPLDDTIQKIFNRIDSFILGGAGGLSDGDYGDITVSGSATVFTVDSGAVDYSEIANLPTIPTLTSQLSNDSSFITSVDLGVFSSSNSATITNTEGTPAIFSGANDTTAGLMIASDKIKIDGIENNATSDQTQADIELLGFFTGAHTVDTDTQLTEAQVDAFVANNGYITGYTVTQGDVTAHEAALTITEAQISDLSPETILQDLPPTIAGQLTWNSANDTLRLHNGAGVANFFPGAHSDDQTAAEVIVDASGFVGNLSPSDTDVQALADTVDSLTTGGATQTLGLNQVFVGTATAGDIVQVGAAVDGSFEIIDWDGTTSAQAQAWVDGDQNVIMTEAFIGSAYGCVSPTDQTIDSRNINFAKIVQFNSSDVEVDSWMGTSSYSRDDSDDYDIFQVCANASNISFDVGDYLRFEVHLKEGQQTSFTADTVVDPAVSEFKIYRLNLVGDNSRLGAPPIALFFDSLKSNNPIDSMPQSRQIAEDAMNAREAARFNGFPSIVRNEAESINFGLTTIGWAASCKYDALFVRQGSTDEMDNIQSNCATDPLGIFYESLQDIQSYNAPRSYQNSGAWNSHGMLFTKLGPVTDGGDPQSTNPVSDFSVYTGHYMPVEAATSVNAETAITNTGTKTYEVNETGLSSDWFHTGKSVVVWTPHTSGVCDFATENATATPFSDAELFEVDTINASSLVLSRVVMPNSSSPVRYFGSSLPSGDPIAHPAGSCIMPVLDGQGSSQTLNFVMQIHPSYGFDDANGNTYFEAASAFFNDAIGYDGAGNLTNAIFEASSSDVTEENYSEYGQFPIDFDGNGTYNDDGIVGGVNRWKEAHELGTMLFTGLPHGSGGTGESYMTNAKFAQVEHVGGGGQHINDDEETFPDMMAQIHRACYLNNYSSKPWYSALVTKHETLMYPDPDDGGAAPTTNDAYYTKWGMSLMCDMPFAPMNYKLGSGGDEIDNWPLFAAVDLTNDTAIANTAGNQTAIFTNRQWGGQSMGDKYNISGIDLDALTPELAYDFQTSTDITDWNVGGNNSGGVTIVHENVNGGRLKASGWTNGYAFGAAHIKPNIDVISTGDADVGDDLLVRWDIGCNVHGQIRATTGQANSSRTEKIIYCNPDQRIQLVTGHRITGADDASNLQRKFRMELPRVNDTSGATPEVYVYSIEIFKGVNIDNRVMAKDHDNMLTICNGTKNNFSPAMGAKILKFPVMPDPDHLPTGIASGEVFDSGNPPVVPAESCMTYIKKTA